MDSNSDNLKFVAILDLSNYEKNIVRDLRNHINVRKYMYSDHIISVEEHTSWLESLQNNSSTDVKVIMFENEPVGVVSLSQINHIHKTADWAFYLKDELQGKGLGSIIEYCLIEYAFNKVGLQKLNCEVLEINPAVIKLHKKFGFCEEGVRRKNIIKNQQYLDVHLLGLLRDEWFLVKPRIERLVARLSK